MPYFIYYQQFGHPNAASSPTGQNGYNTLGVSSPASAMHYNNGQNSYTNNGYSNNTNSLPRNGTMSMEPLADPANSYAGGDLDDRGRSKKRNFFGTLKKRLSRSKTRTHSADHGALKSSSQQQLQQQHQLHPNHSNNNVTTPTGTLNGDSRSLSVDRAVLSKSNSLGNYPYPAPQPLTAPLLLHKLIMSKLLRNALSIATG